jgi:hypothetical protein
MVSSLPQRWIAGTLHHRLSDQQMPYNLDEFTFRFNRRNSGARDADSWSERSTPPLIP